MERECNLARRAMLGLGMSAIWCAAAGGLGATAGAAERLTLVRDGRPLASIVVGAEARPAERFGAVQLQETLREITGAELPVVTDPERMPERAILVGSSRHLRELGVTVDARRLGEEGFLLRTMGRRLAVAGAGERGTMYGCFDLLERLGVRWFTPTVTRAPRRRTIAVDPLDVISTPAFEYREPFFFEAQERLWAARNRVNGHAARLDASVGGRWIYYPFVHSFDDLIPRELYATHPEYFPLIDGQRRNGYVQRCLSQPAVLRLAIATVRRWMREHSEARIFSVSQNDTGNWCRCGDCERIAARYGGQSGLYLWFVNEVAAAVETEFPDRLIDTLAYQFTEPAPAGIVPRKNVRIRLCPIACCQAHPYEQCGHPANVAFLKALREWSRITDTLYIWHYNTNFAHYLMPFPDFDEFPAEARLYRRSGVKGIFFQGAYADGGGGSDAELRSWVMARLLWNPDLDADALVTEWMQGVYGAAWKPMRRWFDLLHRGARDPSKHFTIYDGPGVHYLAGDVPAQGETLLSEAAWMARRDPVATRYVEKARLDLRYVRLMQYPGVSPDLNDFLAAVRARQITQLREGRSLDDWAADYRLRGGARAPGGR